MHSSKDPHGQCHSFKLAETFGENLDVIETGIWSKESFWVHKKAVMTVAPIPIDEENVEELGQNHHCFVPIVPKSMKRAILGAIE